MNISSYRTRNFGRIKYSFTLLELLIVIAVICILTGILLPCLQQAKNKAKEIQCKGNLRQLGLVSIMYANDFNNICHISYDTTTGIKWSNAFISNAYVSNLQMLLCPSWSPEKFQNANFTYGMAKTNCYVNITALSNPSQYDMFADSLMLSASWLSGNNKQTYFYYRTSHYPPDDIRHVHLRHFMRSNIWFVDGHVNNCNRDFLFNIGIREWLIQ